MSKRPPRLHSAVPNSPLPIDPSRPRGSFERTVVAYGVRIVLRSDDPAALETLLAVLPGRWKPTANGGAERVYSLVLDRGSRYVLYRDDFELGRSQDVEQLAEHLVPSAGFYFAEHSKLRTFIHAGAVAWEDVVILLPGRQGSGKTTLTAALVRAGATYLSDDYAPIDDRGHVHPFPRPLSVRRANGLPPVLTPVESLGGEQETRALPVGLVVFAPYVGARRWRPRLVPPGKGVLNLLRYAASAQTRPRQALDRLGRIVAAAPVLKGGRGEADDTARLILRRLNAVRSRASAA